MPKAKGGTNQQWMDRIRVERGELPLSAEYLRESMMERAKAAVCYINTGCLGRDDPSALMAFMTIFHPDFDAELTAEMVRDQREKIRKGW